MGDEDGWAGGADIKAVAETSATVITTVPIRIVPNLPMLPVSRAQRAPFGEYG
ncbi:hypothetical protein ACFB49_20830 [Sphingomonas sp. DBB INV C78]